MPKIKLKSYTSLQECSSEINRVFDIFAHTYNRAPKVSLIPCESKPKKSAHFEIIASGGTAKELELVKKILSHLPTNKFAGL